MPVAMTKGGQRYYLAYDQVGTLRAVADASGNAVKRIQYDSFGNVISDSDTAFAVPFGFAGGLYDADTGLIRFGYRDYDPDTGRWTAKDPILFVGGDTDLYGYCLGDPVNWVDLNGLASIQYRPLSGMNSVGWSPHAEKVNRVRGHQHIWFDNPVEINGKEYSNIGFFDNEARAERIIGSLSKYSPYHQIKDLDDEVLAKAVEMTPPRKKYKLLPPNQYNCQDWIDDVLKTYWKLMNNPCP
ncbi:hypothetical protein DENIS_0916 [Desulfonema ishimotonii]|uniref:Teneurin-like YD-shell domain-containing protein n=1 Tax=Desulfonema ishimotonii TaxID=45657 RepID=A0A401FSM6_9BACT|nr:RHS repeat-associated core domain-containing protein [Desulfonema ishimotonii]GBC59974.1 hypothetical protein DENIS_0916 [Desulfonema ishimotonii]